MADMPKLSGIRPVPQKEAEEVSPEAIPEPLPEVLVPATPAVIANQFIRPEHKRRNLYPTLESGEKFEDMVAELAEDFRKRTGRKIPQGYIHEAALSWVIQNWDLISAQFRG